MTPVYIRLDKSLLGAIDDSEDFRKAVDAELRERGVDAQVNWGPNPLPDGKYRDVVLIILAVGAAGMMIGSAVKKVIDAHTRGNPTLMKEKRVRLDGSGNVVRDKEGNPVFETTETPLFAPEEKETTALNVAGVFDFSASTGVSEQGGQ